MKLVLSLYFDATFGPPCVQQLSFTRISRRIVQKTHCFLSVKYVTKIFDWSFCPLWWRKRLGAIRIAERYSSPHYERPFTSNPTARRVAFGSVYPSGILAPFPSSPLSTVSTCCSNSEGCAVSTCRSCSSSSICTRSARLIQNRNFVSKYETHPVFVRVSCWRKYIYI